MKCPDGGTCHHDCKVACFRVMHAEPLSGVYPDDRWPDNARREPMKVEEPRDYESRTATHRRSRVQRDYERELSAEKARHAGALRRLLLAKTAATQLAEKFPDDPCPFDSALIVLDALENAGVVFAEMGGSDG